jgi:hypothetical protein
MNLLQGMLLKDYLLIFHLCCLFHLLDVKMMKSSQSFSLRSSVDIVYRIKKLSWHLLLLPISFFFVCLKFSLKCLNYFLFQDFLFNDSRNLLQAKKSKILPPPLLVVPSKHFIHHTGIMILSDELQTMNNLNSFLSWLIH